MTTINNSITQEPEKSLDSNIQEEKTKIKLPKKNIFVSRLKRRILRHTWVLRIFLSLGVLTILTAFVLLLGMAIKNTKVGFYMRIAGDFIFTPSEKVKSSDNRTNILILGKGGKGHEAPDLTDTIMFASIAHSSPSLVLVSLPRDIWVSDLKIKLNSAYYWGNRKEAGGGLVLSKSTVEEIVGQPIHYAVVIDFSGFKKIIDILGGIEVDVQNSFTDKHYPIAGREDDTCGGDTEFKCRYETISFQKGTQHMDGETALKFVRSRDAEGDEGTDLARAARQQKVIEAIKKKVLSKETFMSPKKLFALKDAVLESIETDLPPEGAAVLARRVLQADFGAQTHVLSEEFIEVAPKSPKYDNLYVFIPKDGNWDKVHEWVKCVINSTGCN